MSNLKITQAIIIASLIGITGGSIMIWGLFELWFFEMLGEMTGVVNPWLMAAYIIGGAIIYLIGCWRFIRAAQI
jgi:hypothetical protein